MTEDGSHWPPTTQQPTHTQHQPHTPNANPPRHVNRGERGLRSEDRGPRSEDQGRIRKIISTERWGSCQTLLCWRKTCPRGLDKKGEGNQRLLSSSLGSRQTPACSIPRINNSSTTITKSSRVVLVYLDKEAHHATTTVIISHDWLTHDGGWALLLHFPQQGIHIIALLTGNRETVFQAESGRSFLLLESTEPPLLRRSYLCFSYKLQVQEGQICSIMGFF